MTTTVLIPDHFDYKRFEREKETLTERCEGFRFLNQTEIKDGDLLNTSNKKTIPCERTYLIEGELNYFEGKVQRVLILIPPLFPFTTPKVIPISSEIRVNTKDKRFTVEYNPQLGFKRQYSGDDGRMCLYHDEYWNGDLHGLLFIINRAKNWLKYNLPGKAFPKDWIADLPPLFLPHYNVLLPKNPILPKVNQGKFNYRIASKVIYASDFTFLHDKRLKTDNSGSFIGGEEYIGKWYKVKKGKFEKIFHNKTEAYTIDLVNEIIGKSIWKDIGSLIKLGIKHTVIGFYFEEEHEWQFFGLDLKQDLGPQPKPKANILYCKTSILEDNLFKRLNGIYDVDHLAAKKVLIIGLGTIGSEVAIELAKAGFSNFINIDKKDFDASKAMRHAADITFTGQSKTEILETLIKRRNPNAVVESYFGDIMLRPMLLYQYINKSDIILSLTGDDSFDKILNKIHLKEFSNKDFIYAKVSKGAFTGCIQVVLPGESSCIDCIYNYTPRKLPDPNINLDILEEFHDIEYGHTIFPGSSVDTKSVAIQVARLAIMLALEDYAQEVLYPPLPGTFLRWHGPAGSNGFEPFAWEIKDYESHPDCPLCKMVKND